jgi:hypothetical protein
MPDPNALFSLASMVALISWLPLAASPFLPAIRKWTWLATGLIIPSIIAVAYIVLIAGGLGEVGGTDFGSLPEIRRVFANDSALAAGWLHYLAFDMVVGTWVARDGTSRSVPALILLPCLVLTFLFGPMGFLLYVLARFAFRSRAARESRS